MEEAKMNDPGTLSLHVLDITELTAEAFGCLHLPDRSVWRSIEGAIGIPVLDPQALRRQ